MVTTFEKSQAIENAKEIRRRTVRGIGHLGVGHIGGCLSIAELLSVLYYGVMNINPENPQMEGRDRLVISKGHSGPALYAVLSMKGYFPESELLTLNKPETNLPSHCDMLRTVGVDMTTGSLGQGFSCAVGVAIGAKLRKDNAKIFTVIGDGECQEGQIWEAGMLAAHKKLDNLIGFIDYNGMQIDGTTDAINSLGDLHGKWEAFGWNTVTVDGHDVEAIYKAVKSAGDVVGKPTMIILKTVKGKGVSFVEAMGVTSHNAVLSSEQTQLALAELI